MLRAWWLMSGYNANLIKKGVSWQRRIIYPWVCCISLFYHQHYISTFPRKDWCNANCCIKQIAVLCKRKNFIKYSFNKNIDIMTHGSLLTGRLLIFSQCENHNYVNCVHCTQVVSVPSDLDKRMPNVFKQMVKKASTCMKRIKSCRKTGKLTNIQGNWPPSSKFGFGSE